MEDEHILKTYYQQSEQRFVAHYVAFAEEAQEQLLGAQQKIYLAQLNAEFENLRNVLLWSINTQQPDYGFRLAGALLRYWSHTVHFREIGLLLNQLLAVRDDIYWTMSRARAMIVAGIMARKVVNYETARMLFADSLTIARKLEDASGIADALNGLGGIALYTGRFAESIDLFAETAMIWQSQGNLRLYATKLHNLAICYHVLKDYSRSLAYCNEALTIFEKYACTVETANTLSHVGTLYIDLERFEEANAVLIQSLAVFRECDILWGIEDVFHRYSALAILIHQYEKGLLLAGLVSHAQGTRPPFEQTWFTHYLRKAFDALGNSEANKVMDIGRQFTIEEGIHCCLQIFPTSKEESAGFESVTPIALFSE